MTGYADETFLPALRARGVTVVDLRRQLPRNTSWPNVQEWEHREPEQITLVAWHYTGDPARPTGAYDEVGRLRAIARAHVLRDWGQDYHAATLTYHVSIEGSGTVYLCNEVEEVTWHATRANATSLGIHVACGEGQVPTPEQVTSMSRVAAVISTEMPRVPAGWADHYGHGELTAYGNETDCPGALLPIVQGFRRTGQLVSSPVVSPLWDGGWPITQTFGVNGPAYAKFGLAGHNGVDFGLPNGTSLYSAGEGVVVDSTNDPQGYGQYVRLGLDTGAQVVYGHMQRRDVKAGQRVQWRTLLGLSNNTGNSTGPHLHLGYRPPGWETQPDNGYGRYVDPLPWLTTLQPPPVEEDDEMAVPDPVLDDAHLVAAQAAIWGPYWSPAAVNFGIPQGWRKALRSGFDLGSPTGPEQDLGAGQVFQRFEWGTLFYHPQKGASWTG